MEKTLLLCSLRKHHTHSKNSRHRKNIKHSKLFLDKDHTGDLYGLILCKELAECLGWFVCVWGGCFVVQKFLEGSFGRYFLDEVSSQSYLWQHGRAQRIIYVFWQPDYRTALLLSEKNLFSGIQGYCHQSLPQIPITKLVIIALERILPGTGICFKPKGKRTKMARWQEHWSYLNWKKLANLTKQTKFNKVFLDKDHTGIYTCWYWARCPW